MILDTAIMEAISATILKFEEKYKSISEKNINSSPTVSCDEKNFNIGDTVRALNNEGDWLCGTIFAINDSNTYDVSFNNETSEQNIPQDNIKYIDEYFNDHYVGQCGSCAVICVVTPTNYIIVSVGDSQVKVCRDNIMKTLHVKHKPKDPVELERINNSGVKFERGRIKVENSGSANFSRSIGDHKFKTVPNKSRVQQPIIADAYTKIYPRFDDLGNRYNDTFILMGCDGFWETLSGEIAEREIVIDLFSDINENHGNKTGRLVDRAFNGGSLDNISVSLYMINPELYSSEASEYSKSMNIADLFSFHCMTNSDYMDKFVNMTMNDFVNLDQEKIKELYPNIKVGSKKKIEKSIVSAIKGVYGSTLDQLANHLEEKYQDGIISSKLDCKRIDECNIEMISNIFPNFSYKQNRDFLTILSNLR